MIVKALELVEENYGTDSSEAAIPILHSLSMVSSNWNIIAAYLVHFRQHS